MKKIKFSGLLLGCFSALLFFSCTENLYIETSKPAQVPVGVDQWKVMVINRFNPQLLQDEDETKVEILNTAAYEAFLGATDAVLDDTTYMLVHTDTISYLARSRGDQLSPEQVREITRQYPQHLLLSLDYLEPSVSDTVIEEYTADFYILKSTYTKLSAASNWTLYDSTGRVMDQASVPASELYEPFTFSRTDPFSGASLQRLAPVITELAYFSGYDYWQRLSPQPLAYTRPIYTNRHFSAAAEAMEVYDWDTAIALLEPEAKSDKRHAPKAAYNLAVIYEAQRKIEEAKYWAQEAAKKNNRFGSLLLARLEKEE